MSDTQKSLHKLKEDNYVITSFSNSLSKIGFDYTDKFIFVKRIEGVSGTRIREAVMSGEFSSVRDMMPEKTIEVLSREKDSIIFGKRNWDWILYNANNLDLSKLNLFNERLSSELVSKIPFNGINVFTVVGREYSRNIFHDKPRGLRTNDNVSKCIH